MSKNIFIATLFLASLSSCCKVDLAIGLSIDYSSLSGNHELTVLNQSIANPTETNTISVHTLDESNNHSLFVQLDKSDDYRYILQVDSTLLHSDTISNFNFETKGRNCKTRVESVSYKLNGKHSTDQRINTP